MVRVVVNHVAELVLDRPQSLNALSTDFARQLPQRHGFIAVAIDEA